MFAYCLNNPVSGYDPSGKQPGLFEGLKETFENVKKKVKEKIDNALSNRFGTVTEGISVSFNSGQYVVSYQIGGTIDTDGGYSLQFTTTEGWSSGAGFFIGLFASISNAKDAGCLEDEADQVGGSLGVVIETIPVVAGADFATIPNKNDPTNPYHGVSVNAGVGTPGLEIHNERTYTTTIFTFKLFTTLGNLIKTLTGR